MRRSSHDTIAIVIFASVLGLLPSTAWAVSSFTCTSGPPVCAGAASSRCSLSPGTQCAKDADCAPSGGTCTYRISGTGTAVSPKTITSVILVGATNVAFEAPPSGGNFTVVPSPIGSSGEAQVLVTDSAALTCTLDVSFRPRALSAVADEEICAQLDGYSFRALSSFPTSQAAGTSTCATRLATCGDGLPTGFEFQNTSPASRILSVRSPISGTIYMQLTKHTATFESALRMFYAQGSNPFVPAADQATTAGSSIIRGTGQWSDIRVTAAVPINGPALSGWAKVLVVVLMLMTMVGFFWRYGAGANRVSRRS